MIDDPRETIPPGDQENDDLPERSEDIGDRVGGARDEVVPGKRGLRGFVEGNGDR